MPKEHKLKKDEKTLGGLINPGKIQAYLSALPYNTGGKCNSPLYVLESGKAHCFEGALFAASCLKRIGYPPLIVDLRAVNDDDHVLAVYREGGLWGALSKSNFTTLQYREPVYRSLRELAMSYFDFYFNVLGEKTLRQYSKPMNLDRFQGWEESGEDLNYIGAILDRTRHFDLISPSKAEKLEKTDEKLLKAGLIGSNAKGLYKPKAG